eukprot:g21191.t1
MQCVQHILKACKLAVVARKDLQMSAGKLAAQVGHAVHDAVVECPKAKLAAWEEDGSMIVVPQADSEAELKELLSSAQRLKLQTSDVQDEGPRRRPSNVARIALRSPSGGLGGSAPRPQVEDETWTVLAIGPDVSARVDAVTGPLGLYSDPLHAEAHELRERLQRAEAQLAELKA